MASTHDPDDQEAIAPTTALRRLDDDAFVAVVEALWERRGWTIVERRDSDSWFVDLVAQIDWPDEQRGLLRIHRPDSETPLSGTLVRHFTRTVQQSPVDQAWILTTGSAPRSLSSQAAEFGVELLGAEEVARLIDTTKSRTLLAEHVEDPIASPSSVLQRAPTPVVDLLDRVDATPRVERLLSGLVPPDPTTADLARASFVGFRAALIGAVGVFVLMLVSVNTGLLFWLLLSAFLLVTYVGLLPTMAIDIYLVRGSDAVTWRPPWSLLATFLFVPAMLVAGAVYWYQRRERTPRGDTWQSLPTLASEVRRPETARQLDPRNDQRKEG
jgi:hypothetical protein